MIVEVCASNFESALAAQHGGAARIELCEQLSVGGLTPSIELIERVKRELQIPVHVLIRPRSGDFSYSEAEIEIMLTTIERCKQLACSGIVSGALTKEGRIDVRTTAKLIEASKGMEFTFHRAFDVCGDPEQGIKDIINSGAVRLLSSGQQLSAVDGIALLIQLKNSSEGAIEIMAGGGVNDVNVIKFIDAGFHSVHLSAIKTKTPSNSLFNTGIEGVSDLEMIRKVVALSQRKSFGRPPGTNLDH